MMTTDKPQLARCPFCKEDEAELLTDWQDWDHHNCEPSAPFPVVRCSYCGAVGPVGSDPSAAVNSWNNCETPHDTD